MSTIDERSATTHDASGMHLGLSWSLAALLREWTALIETATADLPHGVRGYQVLRVAVHDAPRTQSVLANRLSIDRTVLTYLIDRYVDCGLVQRQQDPSDRRARRIVATARGRSVLAEVDVHVAAAEEKLLAELAPAERAQFRDLLERAAYGADPGEDPCSVVAHAVTPTVE